MGILNYFGLLWWEKIGKNIEQQKLSIVYVFVIKMSKLGCAKSYLCIYYLQCLCFGVLAVWVSWLQYVCPGENNSQKRLTQFTYIFAGTRCPGRNNHP